jgi:hypothetical protein
MARACCAKPNVRIINVENIEAGLLGLDQALQNVYISGLVDGEEIQRALLKWIMEFGNYVAPSRESDYGKALLREYQKYVMSLKRDDREESVRIHKP